jgi:hypothetical protein
MTVVVTLFRLDLAMRRGFRHETHIAIGTEIDTGETKTSPENGTGEMTRRPVNGAAETVLQKERTDTEIAVLNGNEGIEIVVLREDTTNHANGVIETESVALKEPHNIGIRIDLASPCQDPSVLPDSRPKLRLMVSTLYPPLNWRSLLHSSAKSEVASETSGLCSPRRGDMIDGDIQDVYVLLWFSIMSIIP